TFERWFRAVRALIAWVVGRWDEAIGIAEQFLAEVEAGSPHYLAGQMLAVRGAIRLARDDAEGALADAEAALELGQRGVDPQTVYVLLPIAAHLFFEAGHRERAEGLVDEMLLALEERRHLAHGVTALHMLAWSAERLGRGERLAATLDGYAP